MFSGIYPPITPAFSAGLLGMTFVTMNPLMPSKPSTLAIVSVILINSIPDHDCKLSRRWFLFPVADKDISYQSGGFNILNDCMIFCVDCKELGLWSSV